LAATLSACGASPLDDSPNETNLPPNNASVTEDVAATQPRTIIIGSSDAISSLDFADANRTTDWEILGNVNIGLLTFEPGTANVVPGVASSFEVSEDGLHYTFILESGWLYPNGRELKAFDFVRGISRSIRLNGSASPLVNPVIQSTIARDDYTLDITLQSPHGDFPQIVTSAAYMPLQDGQLPDDELINFPNSIVGVGAWQIVEYSQGEEIVFERNPNFKLGFEDNAPERVIIRSFEDPFSLANALESGEIDLAWRSLDFSSIEDLNQREELTVFDSGFGGTRTLLLNHNDEYLRSTLVREAIARLIDRNEILDQVFQGNAHPLYSAVPPAFVGANQAFLDIYGDLPDVDAANILLAEAGYFEFEPVKLTLLYPEDQYGLHSQEVANLLQNQLELSEAIQVTLQPLDWITFLSSLLSGEYQLIYLGWAFDRYPDTSNYLETFALSDISSRIGIDYKLDEMDDLLKAAGEATEPADRVAIYAEAQTLFAQELVSLPLLIEPEFAAWDNQIITNLIIGPVGYLHYELIQLAD
jgi:peptide/nickel transport system substrate-binding protein